MEFNKELQVTETNIPGLVVFDLPVYGDNRGWFKENWQKVKLKKLGIDSFSPVQNNISFNTKKGTTRGIHAEPWNKFISIGKGRVFGAWVDLRPGDNFGTVFTCELDPSKAIYVPRGVGNSFQTLEDDTVYTYLVDAHWSADLKNSYTFVNLKDPQLNIHWPIPLDSVELSDADRNHPSLSEIMPMAPKRILVTGANGQLGRAIKAYAEQNGIENIEYCDIDTFDFSNPTEYEKFNWSLYSTIINAGAYTAVDKAETEEGRIKCWEANAKGPSLLAKIAQKHGITLVHVSSDYVFNGIEKEHLETEPLSPLGVYGQSKAAGDIAVSQCDKYYILRSSWVIGDGHNFVKTMAKLSDRCADSSDELSSISVVNDQFGRLTFTDDMAKAIFFLLNNEAEYGIYNFTGSGKVKSWFEIAKIIFSFQNDNAEAVCAQSTVDYFSNANGPISLRPTHSALCLNKIQKLGFVPSDWEQQLNHYLAGLYS